MLDGETSTGHSDTVVVGVFVSIDDAPCTAGAPQFLLAGGTVRIEIRRTMDDSEKTKFVTLKLTMKELEILTALASDQLFRREFIDPKMPGYRPDLEDLKIGKALVGRLRSMSGVDTGKRSPLAKANGAGA